MLAVRGLWRWRHNPLCRTTDLREAWVALAALLFVFLVAPVIGAVAGSAAQDALHRSVREQEESRHLVTATVIRELERPTLAADPETAAADTGTWVRAHWTAPDGTERHGPVAARLTDPAPGDRFTFWADEQGRAVARPLDPATATTHAVLAGFGAALLTLCVIEGGRRLVVWRMVLRRYARWDQEWDRVGPDWGRTGTGI
ncbi:Rv1733c family protein [Streptomyces sp. NPDC002309]